MNRPIKPQSLRKGDRVYVLWFNGTREVPVYATVTHRGRGTIALRMDDTGREFRYYADAMKPLYRVRA